MTRVTENHKVVSKSSRPISETWLGLEQMKASMVLYTSIKIHSVEICICPQRRFYIIASCHCLAPTSKSLRAVYHAILSHNVDQCGMKLSNVSTNTQHLVDTRELLFATSHRVTCMPTNHCIIAYRLFDECGVVGALWHCTYSSASCVSRHN